MLSMRLGLNLPENILAEIPVHEIDSWMLPIYLM
jgi:hypothetical protein